MEMNFWSMINQYRIIIPIIQRDYAQGRQQGKVPAIRENMLNAICGALQKDEQPLELDFIYGYTRERQNQLEFYPLDGQQRLTTLFLLYWYIGVKEDASELEIKKLSRFSYEIRHSSEMFCSELVNYKPDFFDVPISENITNQPWFFAAWNNDPTVRSMLTMLDAIQAKVEQFRLKQVWGKLTAENPPIVFHLLDTDKLGMPDELYIKMNSRGKELTDFEYFKIRFSEILKSHRHDEFNHKIDQQWSDLFWDLYKEDQSNDIALKVDNAFLRFFRYITDIIISENGVDITDKSDEFQIYSMIYDDEQNVDFLFRTLDMLVELFSRKEDMVDDYFSTLFYIEEGDYAPGKVRLFFGNPAINLFKKCANAYDAEQRNNPFSIGEQLLLYACIINIIHKTDFITKRIRIIRNLIANSEDTVRKENMQALLQVVNQMVRSGSLNDETKFSKSQADEEKYKDKYLEQYPEMLNVVCFLEDHFLLQGCTSIFEFSPNLSASCQKFYEIFTPQTDFVFISRVLMTMGDYTQNLSWRCFLGNRNWATWRELFTPSLRRGGFEKTKSVLQNLIKRLTQNPDMTLQRLVELYLEEFEEDPGKEKDWRYYYIKYAGFRFHTDGYYYWPDSESVYKSLMLRRSNLNGFHWDPVLYTIYKERPEGLELKNYGAPLHYWKGDIFISMTNHNNHFAFEAKDSLSLEFLNLAYENGLLTEEYKYFINQSESGLDIEDRIQRGLQLLETFEQLEEVEVDRMTLHEAIRLVLSENTSPMNTSDIAEIINSRSLYRRGDGASVPVWQIRLRCTHYPQLFEILEDGMIGLVEG